MSHDLLVEAVKISWSLGRSWSKMDRPPLGIHVIHLWHFLVDHAGDCEVTAPRSHSVQLCLSTFFIANNTMPWSTFHSLPQKINKRFTWIFLVWVQCQVWHLTVAFFFLIAMSGIDALHFIVGKRKCAYVSPLCSALSPSDEFARDQAWGYNETTLSQSPHKSDTSK